MGGRHVAAASLVAETGSRKQAQSLQQLGLAAHGMWNLPRPGIEPMSPAFGRQILTHWTTREVLLSHC